MRVSIITGCYNRQKTLLGAVESVLAQDCSDIEYIIVDGASKDDSVKVVKDYILNITDAVYMVHQNEVQPQSLYDDTERWRKGFHLLTHGCNFKIKMISEPDKGMYEALNKGIRMASGEIIGLVHSDDFLYDEHVVSDYVKKFEKTQADLVYADGLFVDQEDTNKVVRRWIGGHFKRWKVRCGWLPLHPTVYIKRDVFWRLGLYNEKYKIAADTDLLVRYLLDTQLRIAYMSKRFVIRMRMGGLSTDARKRKQMWNEDVQVYASHGFIAVHFVKLMKMSWKVPQFVMAFLNR